MRSPCNPWSRRSLRTGAFWLIMPWLFGNCGLSQTIKDEFDKLHSQLTDLQAITESQGHRIGRIEDFLTYCPDEVQRLVGRVEKECEKSDTCTLSEADIRIEVKNVAPWLGGKFLSLMQDRKHVALYVPPDGKLGDADKKQLRDLVLPAWLSDGARRTRFLVVSHATDNQPEPMYQASKRGKYIIREITSLARNMAKEQQPVEDNHGLPGGAGTLAPGAGADALRPADGPPKSEAAGPATESSRLPRYLLHWTLPFPRGGEQLRPEDRPRQATDKLATSVFVYRVDC